MDDFHLLTVESAPLRYLISVPKLQTPETELRPVLCFLHGYDEAAPLAIRKALTRHGPLRKGSSHRAGREFIVIAPQVPAPAGDVWHRYGDHVLQIVSEARRLYHGDESRTYLTGFSFGANGVFDLSLIRHDFWAAIWPVDPTRIPERDPKQPVWLSFGEVSRRAKNGFIRELGLKPAHNNMEADRIYLDQGQDHVGSATLAYRDDRIYAWLLSKKLIKK